MTTKTNNPPVENHDRSQNHITWLEFCYEELNIVRNSLKKFELTFNEGTNYEFLANASSNTDVCFTTKEEQVHKDCLNHPELLFSTVNFIQNKILDELRKIDVDKYTVRETDDD